MNGFLPWAEETLYDLVDTDIVKGYDDGEGMVTVRPNAPITRAELTSLLVRVLDLKAAENTKTFTDVPKGKWFYNDVNTAASLGIVSGINATQFAPNFITLILRHRTLKKKWSH
ncbi:hypothetical protein AM501_31085 [Aneurinibacillus migulanus]|uniref:S-layer homology domain-containing protein n=1 Tax=Aneurinibacillus migulanus TaxID=47500 RepID=UPI0005B95F2F|nr:S-layer homology domain-containing protein [Aneurinibacillus migulanus]KIV56334.1 hypothetical protein TS64_09830 [Aneurinibacillus migulanus]KPD04539.1 hypothetical protein AM501_31085 [Aneurinibacillus migulanus]